MSVSDTSTPATTKFQRYTYGITVKIDSHEFEFFIQELMAKLLNYMSKHFWKFIEASSNIAMKPYRLQCMQQHDKDMNEKSTCS
jgi:hypothetical protein